MLCTVIIIMFTILYKKGTFGLVYESIQILKENKNQKVLVDSRDTILVVGVDYRDKDHTNIFAKF